MVADINYFQGRDAFSQFRTLVTGNSGLNGLPSFFPVFPKSEAAPFLSDILFVL
ncbi:Uncharacterized protein dnm_027470 [Desulfonema magnum]|uniref:Uncharacterized protein n=1 Tax=Desulfonema magnum TaxID=45655 RepID=A0A975BJX3_9BACT|nr:Uncharacterized protein dnm_027470 [Desulfonema magnum]